MPHSQSRSLFSSSRKYKIHPEPLKPLKPIKPIPFIDDRMQHLLMKPEDIAKGGKTKRRKKTGKRTRRRRYTG